MSEHQHSLPKPESVPLSWVLLPSFHLQHGGIVLIALLLLDKDSYSDFLFFSCNIFKITSNDKTLHYMFKSEYQMLGEVNLLRTGKHGFHSQR